jgi:hypothetical protein
LCARLDGCCLVLEPVVECAASVGHIGVRKRDARGRDGLLRLAAAAPHKCGEKEKT